MFGKIATVYIVLQAVALSNGKLTDTYLKATRPANCTKNYCYDKSDDYPQKLIDELIEKKNVLETDTDLDDRDGDGERGKECEELPRVELIYEIIDNNNNTRYVVQTSDNATRPFRQKITVKECVKPGPITDNTANLELNSTALSYYNFFCEQAFIDYTFLVISLDGQNLDAVQAKIPCCCKCIVKEK